ncbi:hypothetical protein VitviT2T_017171 [Vitis vinifera]|uniref:Sodium transporter HKT1 n=2 Tax=Vitis vinifera TaxID=29760 RepID=A0ABY9CWU7_VITVI|nr:sodium transporter HKT1 [Vitis vinifera]WJZ98660.1 hypothetical protein VitviT2T_017171 [Vitis vinifera]|eukprot:XP_002268082.1 PREDICTED: sodium transporter HKT1 [Vitis vinifera]
MGIFASLGEKFEQLYNNSRAKMSSFRTYFVGFLCSLFDFHELQLNSFVFQFFYYIILSVLGFLALKLSVLKATTIRLADLDLFFTAVSASTVSSMSTVEMELFSNTQLVIITALMLMGGEIFTSMLRLNFVGSNFTQKIKSIESRVHDNPSTSRNFPAKVESGLVVHPQLKDEKPNSIVEDGDKSLSGEHLRNCSIKLLGHVVIRYIFVIQILGAGLIFLYVSLVPSAKEVLKNKGIQMQIFSVFTAVSTFSNCGFVPTNENMKIFKKNSGLLLFLIPQVLLGNTLFAPALRCVIWVLGKTTKRVEYGYMLNNSREIGYNYLLPSVHSFVMAIVVLVLIVFEFLFFCSMEWNSEALYGLDGNEKFVASLFQVVNLRHTGESVFDLSIVTPAVLVVFIVMMYLPARTSFFAIEGHETDVKNGEGKTKQKRLMGHDTFSPLTFLVPFVIFICMTERDKLKEDPLNFNVLSIALEVISAYANVGLSTGYHCARQLKPDPFCKPVWYGFVGRWSAGGKLLLVIVMFLGKLRKFGK